MFHSLKAERKDKIEHAGHNLEEIMHRIHPFIRRPKEEPKERLTWVSSNPANQTRYWDDLLRRSKPT